MSKNVYSDNLMFEQGIYSLLGERLIDEYFVIIDFDSKSSIKSITALDPRREVIGFASNDISYYKAERAGIKIVLDKRAGVKDLLNFFLFRRSGTFYRLKSTLTLREKETLLLLTEGLSIKDVARELGLNENTVYTLRRNILVKLEIKNRIDLINYIV